MYIFGGIRVKCRLLATPGAARDAGLSSPGAFERGTVIDVRNKRRIYVIDVYRRTV